MGNSIRSNSFGKYPYKVNNNDPRITLIDLEEVITN